MFTDTRNIQQPETSEKYRTGYISDHSNLKDLKFLKVLEGI